MREVKKMSKNNMDKLLNDKSPFGIKEAYSMARTSIIYLPHLSECPVYGFTSAVPNEGKSLSASNIAISFARLGKKVLLIDCDIRSSTQGESFGIKGKIGLSEYLSGITKEPVVQRVEQENLFLMTAGKRSPDPSELLHSERMKQLISDMKKEYNYIFLDCPPINIVADATLLAPLIDGYIIVIRSGFSDSREVLQAVKVLKNINAKISGFVLNDVNPKGGLSGCLHSSKGGYNKYGSYYDQ